jgi:hypothetical protein
MIKLHGFAALCAAAALTCAIPARAESDPDSEKLRRLDIMLMVTGLRCRTGDDNFQADFQAFEAHHLAELNGAAQRLKADFAVQYGPLGADRELDHMGVVMANQYGGGHPWLGCHDLKMVAHDLAEAEGPAPLLAVADELLVGDGPRLAMRTP